MAEPGPALTPEYHREVWVLLRPSPLQDVDRDEVAIKGRVTTDVGLRGPGPLVPEARTDLGPPDPGSCLTTH